MPENRRSALQTVLAAMIDPVNQLFLHSRMLRAWGHSRGMDYHESWLAKMRRTTALVEVMLDCGETPGDRPPSDLVIGADPRAVFAADAGLARRTGAIVRSALDRCADPSATALLTEIAEAERAEHERLTRWLSGPEAGERPCDAKHLGPKPGAAPVAVSAINRVVPHMAAAVSQIFIHSLMFGRRGKAGLARRELDAALAMMYRTEALLERLLDLQGRPTGAGHGLIRIEPGADRTALEAHERIIPELRSALDSIDGLADPMTHTLFDGILRAERQERDAIALRLDSASAN